MVVVAIKSDVQQKEMNNEGGLCSNTAATSLSDYKHKLSNLKINVTIDKHYNRFFLCMICGKSI